jgi:hypothetical protein
MNRLGWKGESPDSPKGLQLIVVRQKLNVVRDFSTNISDHAQLSEILTTPWSESRNPDHAMVTATTTVVRKLRAY